MPYSNITGTIPPLVVTEVTAKLNEVLTALEPYTVGLTQQERATLYKMGGNRYSLGQKTITVCDTYTTLVPGFVQVDDVKDDFTGYGQMQNILPLVQQIVERLEDTMMARGSEVLTKGTLPVYASVKAARQQGVPGADAAFELLNPYFDLPDQPDGGNP